MATQDDVRRLALALPATTEGPDDFRFNVVGKGFAWVWLERLEPKRARTPNPSVVAIRVADESEKEALIDMDPAAFFTEPHYNGYPAILVRLDAVDPGMLEKLLRDAWRIRAPRRLVREMEAGAGWRSAADERQLPADGPRCFSRSARPPTISWASSTSGLTTVSKVSALGLMIDSQRWAP